MKKVNITVRHEGDRPPELLPVRVTLRPEAIQWCKDMLADNGGNGHTITLKLVHYSDAALVTALTGGERRVRPDGVIVGGEKELGAFTITKAIDEATGVAVLKAMRDVLHREALAWEVRKEESQ